MTDNVTNNMKQKAKGAPPPFDPEEIRAIRQGIEDLKESVTSVQILVRNVTDVEDFTPPLVVKLQGTERAISETSGDMSATTIRLNDQVKRIETVTTEAFEQQVAYIRKLAAVVIVTCNLPGTVGLILLAWRLGVL